jgi:PAS domain S-box-containing protein
VDLARILRDYREQIIEEWVRCLHTGPSERYRDRTLDELSITVEAAYEAQCAVLIQNDFSKIDCHIEWITNIRLQGGFSLSEVQNAYELCRTVLLPVLVKELEGEKLLRALIKLNEGLFYAITKFSNYFQSLHERQIKGYAQNLEGEVDKRTKELAESEAKYRVLIEDINDGYFVNQKGTIVFANRAYCDLHGLLPQETIGKSYTDLVAIKSLPLVRRLYEDRMAGENSDDLYTYFRRHKDGSSLPTENKVKRILYQGELAVAGICRDITGRIETERRIRESERFAHIGKLTTSLAHEIRNPLSSVKMNIQIFLKNMKLNGNDKRRMEIMLSETSRLERILDEMLDFARPVRLNLEPGSMNEIIDSCLEMMEAKIREKSIAVVRRYSRSIPHVPVDHEKIEQAIINILLNSVEALPDCGKIEVTTKQTLRDRRAVKVEISDDGPGISSSDLPYVFDPFFSNKKKGTGLGLSNVKKIIEAHGGAESVVPRKPQGIRFSFTIPFREVN